ncbi:hypothetical protein BDR04DRAFT_1103357 [Suillus decipiens]|nr:hypothetical protein BDR04DRAFT_1103357 [Suillus decipiens]
MLVADLKEYHKCSGVLSGGQADALNWWETLPISAERCPLAIIINCASCCRRGVLFLGSGWGTVCKTLQPISSVFQVFQEATPISCTRRITKPCKPARRKHTHMHTQPEHGLDIALANELQRSFAWVPPLTGDSCNSDDEFLAGPESMTDEELLGEFSRFENEALKSCHGLQEGAGEVPDIFEGHHQNYATQT